MKVQKGAAGYILFYPLPIHEPTNLKTLEARLIAAYKECNIKVHIFFVTANQPILHEIIEQPLKKLLKSEIKEIPPEDFDPVTGLYRGHNLRYIGLYK